MQDKQGKSGTNRGISRNQPIKRGCKKPIKRTDFITDTSQLLGWSCWKNNFRPGAQTALHFGGGNFHEISFN